MPAAAPYAAQAPPAFPAVGSATSRTPRERAIDTPQDAPRALKVPPGFSPSSLTSEAGQADRGACAEGGAQGRAALTEGYGRLVGRQRQELAVAPDADGAGGEGLAGRRRGDDVQVVVDEQRALAGLTGAVQPARLVLVAAAAADQGADVGASHRGRTIRAGLGRGREAPVPDQAPPAGGVGDRRSG